jgi:hypothetical protein
LYCTGITSPEGFTRSSPPPPQPSTTSADKWKSKLDPIGGGRKQSRSHTHPHWNEKHSHDRRKTPLSSSKKWAVEEAGHGDHLYGVSPVYIALLAGMDQNLLNVTSGILNFIFTAS